MALAPGSAPPVRGPVPRRRRRVRHVRRRAQDRGGLVSALLLRHPLRRDGRGGSPRRAGGHGVRRLAREPPRLARGARGRRDRHARRRRPLSRARARTSLPGTDGAARAPGWAAVLAGLGRVLGNRHTWPPFLAFFFLYSATNNLFFWIVPCLRDLYGLGLTDAALYATATSLALLVAGPLTGFVSDRVLRRRRLPYTVLTAAQFVAWVVFVLTLGRLPLSGLYLAAVRHGDGGGGVRPDLAARPRGQPARARRGRGGGGEPRRVRGSRPDPGAARRPAGRPLGGGRRRRRARLPGRGVPGELRRVRGPHPLRGSWSRSSCARPAV